jgi:hypothetical protein
MSPRSFVYLPALDDTNYDIDLLIIQKEVAVAHVKVPYLKMCEGSKKKKILNPSFMISGLPAEIRTED